MATQVACAPVACAPYYYATALGYACAVLLLYSAISTPLGCGCALLLRYAAISNPRYYINYVISK